jgi:hypothetical protein
VFEYGIDLWGRVDGFCDDEGAELDLEFFHEGDFGEGCRVVVSCGVGDALEVAAADADGCCEHADDLEGN